MAFFCAYWPGLKKDSVSGPSVETEALVEDTPGGCEYQPLTNLDKILFNNNAT